MQAHRVMQSRIGHEPGTVPKERTSMYFQVHVLVPRRWHVNQYVANILSFLSVLYVRLQALNLEIPKEKKQK
jgi:hypothetical protein